MPLVSATTGAESQRTVVFPPLYFEQTDSDDPVSYLEGRGYENVVANDDGSYAATMTSDEFAALVKETRAAVAAIIDALPADEDYPHVVAVDYDEQFATVTVSFDSDKMTAEDALVAYVPGEAAVIYQQIAGLPVGCDVILVGSDGSELADTAFPVDPGEGTPETAKAEG